MDENEALRENILNSMDRFIEKIQSLRAILLGVSISGLILAPFAIGISVYLITHPKFLLMVEKENEFGFMLIVLLVGILVVSGIWLVTGLRQYKELNTWNRRYYGYLKRREELDKSIYSQYRLDENEG